MQRHRNTFFPRTVVPVGFWSQVWSAAFVGVAGAAVLLAGNTTATAQGKQKARQGKKATAARPAENQVALLEAKQGDWSRWRGPNNDGVSLEKGLLTEWPAEGPPLTWKAEGLGSGFASVSVAKGHIYTLGSKEGEVVLHCRSVEDGSPAWETSLGNGEAPNCTPTVDGELVFGITKEGILFCCETKSGDVKWQKNFREEYKAQQPGWGFSESPLIDGDLVIATPGTGDAVMVALNKQTGEQVWQAAMPEAGGKGHGGAGYASPVIGHCGGVKQYITLVGKGVIGVSAENGKLLWGYNRVANGTASIPTPIVQGDFVFCSSGYGDGGTALLKISKQGKNLAAEELWWRDADKLQNHHGGMIAVGNHVYMGHGHNRGLPVCVEIKSGEPAWGPLRGAGGDSAAIAYADGHLYFRYQDGIMALIEATPTGYKLKGKFKLATRNGESWPHPVIAGGKLYLRDQDNLLCYDVRAQK